MRGVRGGIPLFLRMQERTGGLLRRLIRRGVRDTGRNLPMRFRGIGALDPVPPSPWFYLDGALMVDFDLEAGYEYLLETYDFIDAERTVALGASYGGYMVILSNVL